MIIVCPHCQKKLRIQAEKFAGKKLSLTCRGCGKKFLQLIRAATKILIAHGEPDVCHAILEICRADAAEFLTCHDACGARQIIGQHPVAAILLDVALPGVFPFQLIDEIQQAGQSTRVILLSSVYNRAAYKRRPISLYGADAYLELHHLPDRLIPLLYELIPGLSLSSRPFCLLNETGGERPLAALKDLNRQAEELARMLVADIALYHQDSIDLGILHRDLEVRLAPQLAEGRQMMACRIPQLDLDKRDYLFAALHQFSSARAQELNAEGEDVHV
jgi:CheY-like chemotaxis protein